VGIEVSPADHAPAARERIVALDRASREATGHEALNEAVWIDLDAPQPASAGFFATDGSGAITGYLHVARSDNAADDQWMLGLAIDPAVADPAPTLTALLRHAVAHVAARGGGTLVLWRMAPTDAEDATLRAASFAMARELFQMRVALPIAEDPVWPDGVALRDFVPGEDDAAWIAVNNRAVAGHAEQGGWTETTLQRRLAEPWFDPALFLLAVDADGILGFNWCKVHEPAGDDPALGEIFVIGVDDRGRGRKVGRPLALAGLDRMARRGITTGMLYCAADNEPALRLYRSLGFDVHRVDRAYECTVVAAG
jgi:mycothiol synthase